MIAATVVALLAWLIVVVCAVAREKKKQDDSILFTSGIIRHLTRSAIVRYIIFVYSITAFIATCSMLAIADWMIIAGWYFFAGSAEKVASKVMIGMAAERLEQIDKEIEKKEMRTADRRPITKPRTLDLE